MDQIQSGEKSRKRLFFIDQSESVVDCLGANLQGSAVETPLYTLNLFFEDAHFFEDMVAHVADSGPMRESAPFLGRAQANLPEDVCERAHSDELGSLSLRV